MNEPRPPEKIPKPPSWLEKDAKSCWKKILPRLKEMRVLRQIDENALARYCSTWVRWRRARTFLEKHGETYMLKDDKGNPKCVMPFPEVAIANKLATELLRLEQQFGMTPASRPNLEVAPAPVDYSNPYSLVSPDDPYALPGARIKKRQAYGELFAAGTGKNKGAPPIQNRDISMRVGHAVQARKGVALVAVSALSSTPFPN